MTHRRGASATGVMMGEFWLGLFCLALGWLCLSHAVRHRRTGRPGLTPLSSAGDGEDEKPAMVIPIALGVLFLIVGKGFLVLALTEMF